MTTLATSWWCHTTQEPWTWTWTWYPGIWLMMLSIIGAYVIAWHRHHKGGVEPTAADRRKRLWFVLGASLLWIATDWPLGALGAGYLASAHMLSYMIYTLGAAPLIMLGTPDWMLRPIVNRLGIHGALRLLAKPVVAGVIFNVILIATHAPYTVDNFRANPIGSMLIDICWLVSGFVLWTPLISPLTELRHPSPAVRCIYLFLAGGAFAMIPGGLLTFANFPLYRTYELAPRVWGISAADDQQAAGILMKVGSMPVIWTVVFVIFFKWTVSDRELSNQPPPDVPLEQSAPTAG